MGSGASSDLNAKFAAATKDELTDTIANMNEEAKKKLKGALATTAANEKGVLMCDARLFSKDLSGQVVIVTGASAGGVGYDTALQLAKQKATVVVAMRDDMKGKTAAEEIGGVYMKLDLSDLESVRTFVAAFIAKYDRLDILVNNAGMMFRHGDEVKRTKEGFEIMFGTNHLGHFLLVALLKDLLEKSAARTVVLSSCSAAQMSFPGEEMPTIDFDDLNFKTRTPNGARNGPGYGQAKLANYLHAMEIPKRFKGVTAVSVHPGWIDSPFFKDVPEELMAGFRASGQLMSPLEGAQTSLHCCLAKIWKTEHSTRRKACTRTRRRRREGGQWRCQTRMLRQRSQLVFGMRV